MHHHYDRGADNGSVVVRQATRKDLDDTSALIGASFSEFRSLVPDDLFEQFIQESMAIDLSLNDRAVFVAERDGRIVGSVTFYSDASRTGLDLPQEWASFRTLAVHPTARRQGVANSLIALCVALAERQSPTLAIHTAEFMTSARRLYTRFGFERSPEHDQRASDLMGTDPAAGDVLVLGYRLELPSPVPAGMLEQDPSPVLLGRE